jgi:Hydantoinase B/oxoprolinase
MSVEAKLKATGNSAVEIEMSVEVKDCQRTMIDPIKFEVIRSALLEATEEMAIALRRSAYSTNIKTRADFSCAFFDRQLPVVARPSPCSFDFVSGNVASI